MKEFHVNDGPFLKSKNSVNKMMRNLFISLLPIILFAVYKNSIVPYINNQTNFWGLIYPLMFILIPVISIVVIELLYAFIILKKRSKDILIYLKNDLSIFYGLFLGLILPINTPITLVILGTVVATILEKIMCVCFKRNIFNHTLISKLLIIVIYAVVISSNGGYLNINEIENIGISTPLSNISEIKSVGTYKMLVEPYGNLFNFFFGNIPGGVGNTSVLLCLAAFIFLTMTKTIKWKIPVVYILTVFGITLLIGNINGLGIWYPLFHIFSGGLIFGAVFLATNPVTSPVTPIGQVLYGLFLGILTIIFRYLTPFNEGVLTSIIIMNLFVIILDKVGSKARFNFKKSLILFISSWILILVSGISLGLVYANDLMKDPNYTIISKEEKGNIIIYTATQKGNDGDIKASITIEDGEVTEFNILDQNELNYSKIESDNYLEKILKRQQDLNNLREVSEAEVTSKALKSMVKNTLIDYQSNGGILYQGDKGFEVLSSLKEEDKIVYEILQNDETVDIKLRIVFKYDVIDSITVIEQNDPQFNVIIDQNYITQLIENQQVLKDYDILNDANIASSLLKRAVINTKKDYWRNYE